MSYINTMFVGEPDASPASIPESLVHEIWRLQQFHAGGLSTVDGRPVSVLDPGILNDDQGPDFLSARIQIGDTIWAGAVEIHRTSADWERHGHQNDPFYESVVLHVSLAADRRTGKLLRKDGSILPEIVLLPRLTQSLRRLNWTFRTGGTIFFACEDHFRSIPESVIGPLLIQLARDRLRRKIALLDARFLAEPDLDQMLYEEIFRSLGYVQNSEAMVILSKRVTLKTLQILRDPRDAYVILIGASGLSAKGPVSMLDSIGDYDLKYRFEELRAQRGIHVLPATIWKKSRLRPANTPARRILQASLLFGPGGPLSRHPSDLLSILLTPGKPMDRVRRLLDIPDDMARYVAPQTDPGKLRLGVNRCTTITANALLPALGLRSVQRGILGIEDQMLSLLSDLPAVTDRTTRRYAKHRGRPTSTAITQGLHELSRSWCSMGRCRDCTIWRHISDSKPEREVE